MSRIAKSLVDLAGADIKIGDKTIDVKGSLGQLSQAVCNDVNIVIENGQLHCEAANETAFAQSMAGTMRSLINNMVVGVTKGFEKKLQIVGVGYRAQAQGDTLNLTLGYSHPIAHKMPAGITVETPTQTEILIKGIDKQLVGQIAAVVRGYRKPEPYKGKGIRYADEVVKIKETKKK